MASPSNPIPSPAPYHEFQRRGPQILPSWTSDGEDALHDHDGAVLYETEYLNLLRAIIKRNDAVLLRKYLAIHPSSLGPGEVPLADPFWIAAAHGSTNALDVMLQHWAANPSVVLAPDARGFRLLQVASAHAQLATARFLIDERRPWASRFGNTHAIATERDTHGQTAILSAASWYSHGPQLEQDDLEELIRLLLSKGARSTDAISPPGDAEPLRPLTMVVALPAVDQPLDTVLSLAASGASADMIERLVDGGADVHARTIYVDTSGLFGGTCDVAWDVTPLHIGSMFANANAIQALRDRRGDGITWRDMVSCRDSHGRLPLHWAAGGPWTEAKAPLHDILRTMELLLADNAADTVSNPDAQGDTPLHYAVRNSVGGAAAEMTYQVAKFLCEKGTSVNRRGANGQTPLHCLLAAHAVRPSGGMMALYRLLFAHGANAGDQDADGNTVLHLAARSAHHLETVRFLLDGARAGDDGAARDLLLRAFNAKGDTALHVAAARSLFVRNLSAEERTRSQDAMMRALTPESWAYGETNSENSVLGQLNHAGKTPRQLCEESRRMWRQQQNAQQAGTTGVGRGRGRDRGRSPVPPWLPGSPW